MKRNNFICNLCCVCFIVSMIHLALGKIEYSSLNGDSGLYFINVKTGKPYLPPFISTGDSLLLRAPVNRAPCSTDGGSWMCCVAINMTSYFNHNWCAEIKYVGQQFGVQMDVTHNDENIYTNMLSASDPPPACFPLPLPIPIPVNARFCVKLFNIMTEGNHFRGCLDVYIEGLGQKLIVLHFDCFLFGPNGVSISKPTQTISDVISPTNGVEQQQNNEGTMIGGPPVVPPQTDSDVFDPVNEVKLFK